MNKMLVANFKMNLTLDEIENYKKVMENNTIENFVIAPSNLYLVPLKSDKYDLCGQNAYYLNSGAFTGEVSYMQLKSIGVKYCLIGHSERRNVFDESDDDIRRKLKSCIENGIIPILCVGEHKKDREDGIAKEVIDSQIKFALDNMYIDDLIVAYEPVWAIGTGLIPNMDDIEEMHHYIKEIVGESAKNVKVLYGGSVNENNIKDICSIEVVDGVLIGKASNDPENMLKLYNCIK